MTAPAFRSLEQLTGELADRPSAFFAANAAADERVDQVTKLTEANQWLDNVVTALATERDNLISDLANARGELDNTMQSLRDVGASVAGLTSGIAMWHSLRDEQLERAEDWRNKYDVARDERDEALTRVQELKTALAEAEYSRDTARAAVSGF